MRKIVLERNICDFCGHKEYCMSGSQASICSSCANNAWIKLNYDLVEDSDYDT